MTLLNEAQIARVSDAITAIEQHTDAELVTVLARQADDYYYIPTLWAAVIALLSPGVVLLTPFWLDAADVLMIQLLVFFLFALILRMPQLLRIIIPGPVKRWRASNLARRMFLENNLHHTVGETGVLIFVSEAEHYVEIIADRGINNLVAEDAWQQVVDNMLGLLRRGEVEQAFLDAVEGCGRLLIEHVPHSRDKNELPNHMIVLE